MLGVNTRTRYRMKALARKRHPSDGGKYQGVFADSRSFRHHYFATRKTPLNTSRILQRSTKGVT